MDEVFFKSLKYAEYNSTNTQKNSCSIVFSERYIFYYLLRDLSEISEISENLSKYRKKYRNIILENINGKNNCE